MAQIRNYINSSLGPRRVARIVTVHPQSRKIEGQLKDGGNIQISLFDVPTFFVWPQEGEYWIVRQDAGYWKLANKFEGLEEEQVGTLNPGEAKVAAEIIRTPSGKQVATVADSDYDWTKLDLLNGWQDVSTFDEDEISNVSSLISIDSKYLTNLPPFGYQYNPFRKSLYFRGIIYSVASDPEIAIIESYKPSQSTFGVGGSYLLSTDGVFIATAAGGGEEALIMNGISIQIDSST